eukprot:scaffold166708_cov17-Prasinocladus_malaysianus.AAC.1
MLEFGVILVNTNPSKFNEHMYPRVLRHHIDRSYCRCRGFGFEARAPGYEWPAADVKTTNLRLYREVPNNILRRPLKSPL